MYMYLSLSRNGLGLFRDCLVPLDTVFSFERLNMHKINDNATPIPECLPKN